MSTETAECKEMTTAYIDTIWENNRKYFQDHEKEFKEKYPGKYIAIHEGEIIGTHENLGTLADYIFKKKGNIPFYADSPNKTETKQFDYPIIP